METRIAEKKSRFQVTKLEERIAPAALVEVNNNRILDNSINHTLNNLHAQVNVLSVGNING